MVKLYCWNVTGRLDAWIRRRWEGSQRINQHRILSNTIMSWSRLLDTLDKLHGSDYAPFLVSSIQ